MYLMPVGTDDEQGFNYRIGAALRGIREAAHLTREQMAEELGVSLDTIGRWERGDSGISAWFLARFLRACGLRPEAYTDVLDHPEPVNPWRERLTRAERDAAEWAADQPPVERRRDRPPAERS